MIGKPDKVLIPTIIEWYKITLLGRPISWVGKNFDIFHPFDEAETLPFRAGRKPRSSCFKLFLSLNLSTLRECNGIKLSLPGGFFPYPNN